MDPVADHIRREAMHVTELWEAHARRVPELENLTRPVLLDHLFELLEGLAAWIEGDEQLAQRAFDALLEGHALQRLGHGISLAILIDEYHSLRSILFRELLTVPSSEQVRSSLVRLHQGLDRAIGASLHRYEQHREQEREQFISVLGHDLRQPLGAIDMAAQILAARCSDSSATTEVVARIERACGRMTRLIEDILGFARTRSGGGIPIDPSLNDMAEICRAAVDEATTAHPGRAIHVDLRGDLRGAFDRDRILQALGNLLSNAIEHGTGPLEVRGCESRDRHVVLVEVTSHGPPIPEDILRRIFDPYATTSPRRGLGLGLYIVQQIAHAHGALCDVTSDEQATTFRMRFPRIPDAARLAKAVP